ncbi:MAG: class I SAM-dependent methyltransferase [Sandaracinaceae bacterium]
MTEPSRERAQRYYDDFSQSYERGRDEGYHALVDQLETSLIAPYARDREVLEVGCGTGLILGRLAPLATRAVGVDVSEGMLDRARARGLTVVHASATELPFGDETFDTVYSVKVLAHVPEIDRALSEISRVLRPGGHAILEFYNRYSLRYLARIAQRPRAIGEAHDEADIPTRWDTPRAMIDRLPSSLTLVETAGVRVVTPFATVHRVPFVRAGVASLERAALRSPLRWLGGFLVLFARKRAGLPRNFTPAIGPR